MPLMLPPLGDGAGGCGLCWISIKINAKLKCNSKDTEKDNQIDNVVNNLLEALNENLSTKEEIMGYINQEDDFVDLEIDDCLTMDSWG